MSSKRSGLGISTVVLIVFIVLKLTGTINWSWWWVLSPLWLDVAAAIVIVLIGVTVIKASEAAGDRNFTAAVMRKSQADAARVRIDSRGHIVSRPQPGNKTHYFDQTNGIR